MAVTNSDLANLIDRNHADSQRRFEVIEGRLDAVESSVGSMESEMVTRKELDTLLIAREEIIVRAIDRRMVYYGRRFVALAATPLGVFILNRIWEVM